jgi:lactose/L-arabinose transport system substrate-binding protein
MSPRRRDKSSGQTLGTTLFALVAIAVVIVLTLAPGWSRKVTQKPNQKSVEIWDWNIAAMSLDALIPGFSAQHPDINVFVTRNGTAIESRLLLSLAANTGAPDITALQQTQTPRFTETKRLLDLTSRAEKYKSDFPVAAWNTCLSDGKLYAMPWDIGPCAIFYRRSIFKQYNINPDSIQTWDDYIAVGVKLREESHGTIQMLALSAADLIPPFEIWMQQNAGSIFDAQGRLILCSPQNVEVLAMMRKMFDAKITASFKIFSPEYFGSFASGKVASYPIAAWIMQDIKDYAPATAGDWGIFPLPAFRQGGIRVSNLGGSTLAIPAQCPNPDAAWEFIQYSMCSVPSQVAIYRDYGIFPAYLPALKDKFFDEPVPFFGNQKVNRLFATDIDKIPPLVYNSDWADAERILREHLGHWADTKQDARDMLRDAQEEMARKFDRQVAPQAEGAADR